MLDPSFLQIDVSTIPEHPSSQVDGGVFTIVVTATNPKPYPVAVVPEPAAAAKFFNFLFSGSVSGSYGSGITMDDASRVVFAAGETKRQYFDLVIGSKMADGMIRPGTYTIFGDFAGAHGSRQGVVIGP